MLAQKIKKLKISINKSTIVVDILFRSYLTQKYQRTNDGLKFANIIYVVDHAHTLPITIFIGYINFPPNLGGN